MTASLRRPSIALPGAILLILAAAPLAAQDRMRGTEADTLGLPADTVRLAMGRVAGMDRCEIPGHAVVKDRADLRRLRRYPQCAKVAPALQGRTLVGVDVNADCQATYRIDAFRSAARREFRVRLQVRGGTCRGMMRTYAWLSLPALPPGWAVRFTESDIHQDGPPDLREWTPLDPSRH